MKIDDGLKKIILLTLTAKMTVLALICLGHYYFPFHLENYRHNFFYPADEPVGFWNAFKTWDAQHYLYLADKGYAANQASNAFYPLFPFLIHITSFFFLGNTLFAGLALSHLLAVVAMAYLYLIVRKGHGEEIARLSCVLLLAFPTGFFLGLVYSESLFLALSAAFFFYWREKRTAPAVFCAFLLPLTRPTGILVLIPALMDLVWSVNFKKTGFKAGRLLPLAGFIAGLVFYFVFMEARTGDFFAGFNAQSHFASAYSVSHLFHPIDWIMDNFVRVDLSLDGIQTGVLNRIFFVALLFVVILRRKRLDRSQFVYALALGLAPVLFGNLMSYTRYVVVIFPFFVILAYGLRRRAEYYLFASLALQALFVLLHSLNYWVA